ncbi:hypothetical protein B0H14DRAFT_2605441 [Mycena olivaceomarginata]|nr:hypothetical protein B0H14DRAFT_2605441 [Mycena olivaceomarginata]
MAIMTCERPPEKKAPDDILLLSKERLSDTPTAPLSESDGATAPRTRSRKRTVSEPKPKCVPKKPVASRKAPGTDSESDSSVVEPVVKPKQKKKKVVKRGITGTTVAPPSDFPREVVRVRVRVRDMLLCVKDR